MDPVLNRFIKAMRDAEKELLQNLGDSPCSEPFPHGVQVGNYQGLQKALRIMEQVIEEEAASDQRR